jgi:membrane fusion protein (multidrug efflux system)
MYVRAELVEGTRSNGLLVPQIAVTRDERGSPTVLVIGAQSKLELRKITAPRTVGTSWLVTAGLKPGEKVVVDGAQNLRPGAAVKPVAPQGKAGGAPAPAAPPAKGQ